MAWKEKTQLDNLTPKELSTILSEQWARAYLDLIKKLGNAPLKKEKPKSIPFEDPIGDLIRSLEKSGAPKHQKIISGTRDEIGELIAQLEQKDRPQDPIGDIIRMYENKAIHTGAKSTANFSNTTTRSHENKIWIIQELAKNLQIGKDIRWRLSRVYENYKKLTPILRRDIHSLSELLGLSHIHVLAVLANESNMNPQAVSPVWARWLPQLMPKTKKGIQRFIATGNIRNAWPEERYFAWLWDNEHFMNIYEKWWYSQEVAIGISYLAYLTKKHGSTKALRIYNGWYNYPDNHENLDYPRRVREFFTGLNRLKENGVI